jgi:hypothetical protein
VCFSLTCLAKQARPQLESHKNASVWSTSRQPEHACVLRLCLQTLPSRWILYDVPCPVSNLVNFRVGAMWQPTPAVGWQPYRLRDSHSPGDTTQHCLSCSRHDPSLTPRSTPQPYPTRPECKGAMNFISNIADVDHEATVESAMNASCVRAPLDCSGPIYWVDGNLLCTQMIAKNQPDSPQHVG